MIDVFTPDERQQAAWLLRQKVERYGWELLLDGDGSLLVRIGDDLPGVPQRVTVAALFEFAPEFDSLLASRTH